MIDQLYADTVLELEKALAGWNDASVIAEELLRQRNEALQLARELRDALAEMVEANGGVAVMPTQEARKQNAALKVAK